LGADRKVASDLRGHEDDREGQAKTRDRIGGRPHEPSIGQKVPAEREIDGRAPSFGRDRVEEPSGNPGLREVAPKLVPPCPATTTAMTRAVPMVAIP
jgi:hypothetical protein